MPVTISLGLSPPHAEEARPPVPTSSAAVAKRCIDLAVNMNTKIPRHSRRNRWLSFERCSQAASLRTPRSQQIAASQRAAHLGQRLLLKLADPLARQIVLVA